MTAIFVYVENDVIFMATDTKRVNGCVVTTAMKSTQWSPNVIIAQTGYGESLTRLLGLMMSWQHRQEEFSTLDGAYTCFKKTARFCLESEKYHLKNPNISGKLILAEPNSSGVGVGKISTFEWISCTKTDHNDIVFAEGTKPLEFQDIAKKNHNDWVKSGTKNIAEWGLKSLSDASSMCGCSVGMPFDLTISKIDRSINQRISVTQRFGSNLDTIHPAFII